jgi:hypothetical protein
MMEKFTNEHIDHFLLEAKRSIVYRKALALIQFNLADMIAGKEQIESSDLVEFYAIISDAQEEARNIR